MSDPSTEVKPLKHAEDLDLVDRAVNGDEDAVLAFQTEYQPMLERVMMSRGVDRVQAQDLVADVIAECFGAGKKGQTRPLLEKFEGRSSLSTWMIRITWNRWLDLKRRDKFKGELPSYEEEDDRAGDRFDRVKGDDPGEKLLDDDLSELMGRAIKAAFDSLDPDVLLMLKLSYLHGISQTVIARMWRCDQTRVSRSLSAAREQIAVVTMRTIEEADSDLKLEWEDFQKLCAAGLDL
ncbi:MAG: sigma-70 family RNA polymerase sigma factor [Verrucomicrobiales bacterium]|jgi:RNA polymerase sigma-70 factor (ECF subfamily)|nr:sigma-70 family RNA polymerase sigma factor [Verrucomicrobiales bacterium]